MIETMQEFLKKIESKAETQATGKHEHLGADGLLHCDECGAATQTRVTVFGEERTVRCICQCEINQQEEEKQQRKRERLAQEIRRLRVKGFDRSELQQWTFAADDGAQPKLMNAMRAYCDGFDDFRADGKGLLLFGDVGTGKTFAAACVANCLIDRGVPVLVTNFTQIINRLQSSFDGRQEYLDSFNDFELLVIDDLAAERKTDFANEIVYSVIDSRYRTGLPMIITSNISPKAMTQETDTARKRIYSRVLERCHPIEVKGTDRRMQAAFTDFADMNKRLGL